MDLGPDDEFLVLALFGTGWRQAALSEVSVRIYRANEAGVVFNVQCPVEYVGKQPTYEGLDQINVRLPRELAGKGDAVVTVSFGNLYMPVNEVQLKFK